MPTMKDIAQRVGVSVSTVSRVINNDTSRQINPETKRRIWEAVEELGYEPNESARSLVQNRREGQRRSMQVGCIVIKPQLRDHHPYFSPILSGVTKGLHEQGYSLAYVHSLEEMQCEHLLFKAVQETPLDGMILIGHMDSDFISYIRKHVPAVVGIDLFHDHPGIPVVDYDRLSAVKAAIDHLAKQGHTRIGFVGGETGQGGEPEEKRFIGYKVAMSLAGLPVRKEWIVETEWQIDNSYQGILEMIDRCAGDLPTAIFAASDSHAIAAMKAVTERGLRVPEDMAFVGVDNIELSAYSSPPLSTIHIPKVEMGVTSAKMLLHYMNNPDELPLNMQIPFQLIIRESSQFKR